MTVCNANPTEASLITLNWSLETVYCLTCQLLIKQGDGHAHADHSHVAVSLVGPGSWLQTSLHHIYILLAAFYCLLQ